MSRKLLNRMPATCIQITNDMQDEWIDLHPLGDVETVPADQIINAVKDAGISGLGGACFPTHIKMTVSEGKNVDTVILNGAECETFLTSDYRLMIEQPDRILDGLRAIMRAMGVVKAFVAIEDNKRDAIDAMTKAAINRQGISIVTLKAKYPQGCEKLLIQAITGREVPSGGLPADIGVAVFNVGTSAAVADAVKEGKPLISRITTVTGVVKEPSNLEVRIGTSFQEMIDYVGGFTEEPGKVFAGGSMTGITVPDLTIPVCKANNGLIALSKKQSKIKEATDCIRCGRCVNACPIKLNPQRLNELCNIGDLERVKKNNVLDCVICGACSYGCPARIPLSAKFKEAKDKITARRI